MAASLLRGGGFCCCCNPFGCLLNFVCACICQIICGILVVFAIVLFIFWLVLRPRNLEFAVVNASLAEFNLDGNNSLRYDLRINFTIANPNERIAVRVDEIEAAATYQGQRFAAAQLDPFYQERNSSDSKSAQFVGQNFVDLGQAQVSNYEEEKKTGEFGIDVRFNMRIRIEILLAKSSTIKPKISCPIHVPWTATPGAAAPPFVPQTCGFVW